ncbi:hypothetical protein KW505_12135 [Vibrio fluvialis]|nr:hypothetical protein [Vibrio fluvialis]
MSDENRDVIPQGFGFDVSKYKKQAEFLGCIQKEYENDLTEESLKSLCREMRGWIETGDTDYLDAAVILLHKDGAPVKGVVLNEAGKLAEARFSRKITESNGKRKKHIEPLTKHLKTKKGRNQFFVHKPVIANVFVLVEICGFYERAACFYAACINEKYLGRAIHKRITTVGVRKLYQDFKKTQDYELLKAGLTEYKDTIYPNMSKEDIERSITNGEVFCKDKFSHLNTDEFTRIKRN